MIRPEHVRLAKRVAIIGGAIGTLGGVAYAAANAVAKAEDVGGHVYTFVSWVGCYVVRTEVTLPSYHEEGMWQP